MEDKSTPSAPPIELTYPIANAIPVNTKNDFIWKKRK